MRVNHNRKTMMRVTTQNGSIHLVLIGIGIVSLIAGAGAWVLIQQHQEKSPLAVKESVAQDGNATSYTQLNATDIERLKDTQPAQPTQPTPKQSPTHTSPKTSPKQNTTPSTTGNTPVTPTTGSISFSADGCFATGTGDAGWVFEVGAYTATKGGSVSYTLPASGTLTKSSGGFKGMQSYGKLSEPSGSKTLTETTTITVDQCQSAG